MLMGSISLYRALFYTLSGIISAIFGWFLSQIFLVDLGQFLVNIFSWFLSTILSIDLDKNALSLNPDFILLPIVGACLAVAMVVTEIFLSNPTRYRANKRVLPRYLRRALLNGALTGLISAVLTSLLYLTGTPSIIVRIVAWSLVGLFTGLGESLSWKVRSIEGRSSQANQRIKKSTLFGFGAGFGAAVLVEIFRSNTPLRGYEDLAGFLILGMILGISLNFATTPTYQVALRAGKGFEKYHSGNSPMLKNSNHSLSFVSKASSRVIEEGLSIRLPSETTDPIIIGSGNNVDIFIPNIPEEVGCLEIKDRQVTLTCWVNKKVKIQNSLMEQNDSESLIHNQMIAFYYENYDQSNLEEDSQLYRFVFYNRFLDPQA